MEIYVKNLFAICLMAITILSLAGCGSLPYLQNGNVPPTPEETSPGPVTSTSDVPETSPSLELPQPTHNSTPSSALPPTLENLPYMLVDQPELLRTGAVTQDFDGDGVIETLTVEVLDEASVEDAWNNPIRVILRICNAEEIFESDFNDGILLYVVDFDDGVTGLDICLLETGTDPGGVLHIYRYADGVLSLYTRVHYVYVSTIVYDGQGLIRFADWLEDTGWSYMELNYREKEIVRSSDWSEEFLRNLQ